MGESKRARLLCRGRLVLSDHVAHVWLTEPVPMRYSVSEWIAEDQNGRPWFNETRAGERQHQIEEVGARLRALMPFLRPAAAREPAGVS